MKLSIQGQLFQRYTRNYNNVFKLSITLKKKKKLYFCLILCIKMKTRLYVGGDVATTCSSASGH